MPLFAVTRVVRHQRRFKDLVRLGVFDFGQGHQLVADRPHFVQRQALTYIQNLGVVVHAADVRHRHTKADAEIGCGLCPHLLVVSADICLCFVFHNDAVGSADRFHRLLSLGRRRSLVAGRLCLGGRRGLQEQHCDKRQHAEHVVASFHNGFLFD